MDVVVIDRLTPIENCPAHPSHEFSSRKTIKATVTTMQQYTINKKQMKAVMDNSIVVLTPG